MLEDAVVVATRHDMTADIKYIYSAEIVSRVRVAGSVFKNLQRGDTVLVAFIGGLKSNPVILDIIYTAKSDFTKDRDQDDVVFVYEGLEYDDAGNSTVVSRYELIKNSAGGLQMTGTGALNIKMEQLDGDDPVPATLEVTGDVDIISGGDVSVTAEGDVNVNASGKVTISASDSIDIDGDGGVNLGNNLVKLLVNNLPNCLFTGVKHTIGNTKVKV